VDLLDQFQSDIISVLGGSLYGQLRLGSNCDCLL